LAQQRAAAKLPLWQQALQTVGLLPSLEPEPQGSKTTQQYPEPLQPAASSNTVSSDNDQAGVALVGHLPLSLPGMTPGAPPASAEQLLQAIKTYSTSQLQGLAEQIQVGSGQACSNGNSLMLQQQ
jgi:hypothetical protein